MAQMYSNKRLMIRYASPPPHEGHVAGRHDVPCDYRGTAAFAALRRLQTGIGYSVGTFHGTSMPQARACQNTPC
ncbi:hypothetical protein HLH34_00335 [Gluconacetobacter azotocaptans]|uniref:Uncharacterized protein n=1 Tax=Gluconacetobacter azotocaptans TaxID=142834 RepID=A0A7W4PDI6_9PROT|nr:hypothetical protein [Gluconacetobacter azotocaptans]MBB2188414.1 hypothetical protein [Gluconacetobacter azotocaptans]MBM9400125.1 hypothetical protein [Gluconacetobacter azotocaptans]GBQ27785.1 hypothetical protein AA13594_0730 [Gluconacetobacter azotocaptans DSM 13594]